MHMHMSILFYFQVSIQLKLARVESLMMFDDEGENEVMHHHFYF